MFFRKWRQTRWLDVVEKIGKLESREFDVRTKTLQKDSIIECEKCGCLIYKEKKHKLSSTIELRDVQQYIQKPPIYYFPWSPYGILQSPEYELITTREEYVAEHYRCERCKEEA